MATGDVEIVLLNILGERTTVIGEYYSASYARSLGFPGAASIEVPFDAYDPSLFQIDGRLEFWREIEGGRRVLDTDAPFFIRRRKRVRQESGEVTLVISGPSAVEILNRRIVAWPAGSAQTVSNGPIDDIMLVVMRENYGVAADPDREVSSDYLNIPSNLSLGSTLKIRYARRNILEIFRELSDASLQTDTPIFFDVVRHDQRALRFQPFAMQRGADHSASSTEPVSFSAAVGNLGEDSLDENYEDEITVAWAGGQGEEADRLVGVGYDLTRLARSPFGWREIFVDGRDSKDQTALNSEAQAAVAAGRPRNTVAASLLSTEQTRYGQHWGFGDRVAVEVFGSQFDAWVNAVGVTLSQGGEQDVTAKVEGVSVSE
jgi:hypothetical protein